MSRGDTTTETTLAHSATIDVVVVVCLFVTFSVAPVLTVVIVVSVVVKNPRQGGRGDGTPMSRKYQPEGGMTLS